MGVNKILTPKDLIKTKPAEPGWYPFEYVGYSEAVVGPGKKTSGSTNCIFEFKALDGQENVKDRKFLVYVNEGYMEFNDSLWATMFPEFYKKGEGSGDTPLTDKLFRSKVGLRLMGYLEQGDKYSNLADFKPMQ